MLFFRFFAILFVVISPTYLYSADEGCGNVSWSALSPVINKNLDEIVQFDYSFYGETSADGIAKLKEGVGNVVALLTEVSSLRNTKKVDGQPFLSDGELGNIVVSLHQALAEMKALADAKIDDPRSKEFDGIKSFEKLIYTPLEKANEDVAAVKAKIQKINEIAPRVSFLRKKLNSIALTDFAGISSVSYSEEKMSGDWNAATVEHLYSSKGMNSGYNVSTYGEKNPTRYYFDLYGLTMENGVFKYKATLTPAVGLKYQDNRIKSLKNVSEFVQLAELSERVIKLLDTQKITLEQYEKLSLRI